MKTRVEGKRVIVSLERGDAVRASVEAVAKERGILGAAVTAIGAIENPELGFYRLDEKRYERKRFPGIWELVSLLGNVTAKDGEPFMHAHVAIGGPDFAVYGGHLFDATTGVVVELVIEPFDRPLERVLCEDIGLHRWEPQR